MSERDDDLDSRIAKILREMDEIYGERCDYWFIEPNRTPVGTVRSLEEFCEQFGIVSQPKFREYEPTDEDKRILSELGIEA